MVAEPDIELLQAQEKLQKDGESYREYLRTHTQTETFLAHNRTKSVDEAIRLTQSGVKASQADLDAVARGDYGEGADKQAPIQTDGTTVAGSTTELGEPVSEEGQAASGEAVGNEVADRRIRISAKPAARNIIYGSASDSSNILKPLWDTGGLMWPFTPTMSDIGNIEYETYDPVHTNQPFSAFKRVGVKEIQISGPFTAMNEFESRYCLAAIHFLRSVTKMYFGVGGTGASIALRGTPPPVLLLNGYGTAMFNNIPVVITNYSVDLPADVDYVQVNVGDSPPAAASNSVSGLSIPKSIKDAKNMATGIIANPSSLLGKTDSQVAANNGGISAWVPTKFNITVTVQVQNSPDRWRRHFNLDSFRTGGLIKNGGWI